MDKEIYVCDLDGSLFIGWPSGISLLKDIISNIKGNRSVMQKEKVGSHNSAIKGILITLTGIIICPYTIISYGLRFPKLGAKEYIRRKRNTEFYALTGRSKHDLVLRFITRRALLAFGDTFKNDHILMKPAGYSSSEWKISQLKSIKNRNRRNKIFMIENDVRTACKIANTLPSITVLLVESLETWRIVRGMTGRKDLPSNVKLFKFK